jgi:xanthine/CO dehydrogenase XdhC/CoxF family maturation factor
VPVADALGPMVSAPGGSPTILITAPAVEPGIDDVVVTSHHDDADAPTIKAVLAAGTTYVGAMGSRRTQAPRRQWHLDDGVTESDLAALRAPIGLDIARTNPARSRSRSSPRSSPYERTHLRIG